MREFLTWQAPPGVLGPPERPDPKPKPGAPLPPSTIGAGTVHMQPVVPGARPKHLRPDSLLLLLRLWADNEKQQPNRHLLAVKPSADGVFAPPKRLADPNSNPSPGAQTQTQTLALAPTQTQTLALAQTQTLSLLAYPNPLAYPQPGRPRRRSRTLRTRRPTRPRRCRRGARVRRRPRAAHASSRRWPTAWRTVRTCSSSSSVCWREHVRAACHCPCCRHTRPRCSWRWRRRVASGRRRRGGRWRRGCRPRGCGP